MIEEIHLRVIENQLKDLETKEKIRISSKLYLLGYLHGIMDLYERQVDNPGVYKLFCQLSNAVAEDRDHDVRIIFNQIKELR